MHWGKQKEHYVFMDLTDRLSSADDLRATAEKAMAAQLVNRVLDLIEFLSECPEGIPLSEICRQKNLPKGAVHRILTAMKERGIVDQDPSSEYYRLTLKITSIGFRLLSESKITDLCQPILDRLAARSGELARLAIAT